MLYSTENLFSLLYASKFQFLQRILKGQQGLLYLKKYLRYIYIIL